MQINIPADVLSALEADSRYIIPQLKIYFDGPDKEPVTLEKSDIVDCMLLTETGTQSEFLVGNVCSGTLELSLENPDGIFNPTNTASPYYGKLVPGVKIEVYVKIDRDLQDHFYTLKMGTYYTASWNSSAGSLTCEVLAYDRLYWILNRETAVIPLYKNITGYDFFTKLMSQLRIENYLIDESLTMVIPFAYVEGTTVGEKLSYACTGCGAVIYVNRDDVVVVQNAFEKTENPLTVNDSNFLYDIKATPTLSKQYDLVTVAVNNIGALSEMELVNIEELEVAPGSQDFSNLSYSNSPVVNLTKIIVRKSVNTKLSSYYTGIQSGSFSFYNSGTETETVTLEIYGKCLVGYTNDVSVGDAMGGQKTEYKIESPLIQSKEFAQYYAGELYSYANTIIPQMEINARGIPHLDMGDVFVVNSTNYGITANVTPIQIKHTLTDGLVTDLVCVSHKPAEQYVRKVGL